MALLGAGGGLLNASQPSRTPVSMGQALGQGVQGGLGGYMMGRMMNPDQQQIGQDLGQIAGQQMQLGGMASMPMPGLFGGGGGAFNPMGGGTMGSSLPYDVPSLAPYAAALGRSPLPGAMGLMPGGALR